MGYIHTDVQVQSQQGKWAALAALRADPVDLTKPFHILPQQGPSLFPGFAWAPRCQTLLRNPWNYLWSLGLVSERSSQLIYTMSRAASCLSCADPTAWEVPKKTKPQPEPGLRKLRRKKQGKGMVCLAQSTKEHPRIKHPSEATLKQQDFPACRQTIPPKHLWSAAFPSDVRLKKCPSWTALLTDSSIIFPQFKHFS